MTPYRFDQVENLMFGSTKCGKCGSTSFKIQEISPLGANYKMFAIQCVSCQTPIGVTDYYSTGTLLKQQEKTLDELKSTVSGMAHQLNQIAHFLNQTRR